MDRSAHEPAAEAVSAADGGDVELCEIALEAAAPDRGTKAKNRQSVRVVAHDQDDGIAVLEQSSDPFCESADRRRGLVELAVEVMEQLRDCPRIGDDCATHDWGFLAAHLRGRYRPRSRGAEPALCESFACPERRKVLTSAISPSWTIKTTERRRAAEWASRRTGIRRSFASRSRTTDGGDGGEDGGGSGGGH